MKRKVLTAEVRKIGQNVDPCKKISNFDTKKIYVQAQLTGVSFVFRFLNIVAG